VVAHVPDDGLLAEEQLGRNGLVDLPVAAMPQKMRISIYAHYIGR
jgi:hypothetical protein